MIKSKDDLRYYLEADRIALGIPKKKLTIKSLFVSLVFPDLRWEYQKTLRKLEYYHNCTSGLKNILRKFMLTYKYRQIGNRLLITIFPNTCGPGLSIAHHGPIMINKGTEIGCNCRIHIGINIGTRAGYEALSANIGNNVYIGPGVKISGPIKIPSNTAIGANSVVTKSFEKEGTTIAGVPAKVIKTGTDTRQILIPATELMKMGIYDTMGMTSIELYELYFQKAK